VTVRVFPRIRSARAGKFFFLSLSAVLKRNLSPMAQTRRMGMQSENGAATQSAEVFALVP